MRRKTKQQTKMQKPYPQVERYAFGQLVETVDTACVTNRFEYDALDRRVATIDGRNNRTAYAYDAKGNLVSTTDAVGPSQPMAMT